ncbi:MAG: hypothetical protein GY833_16585 [Aestuariibacter sp.]|nr:hypothetical protein [Aestuariibacter sp.]
MIHYHGVSGLTPSELVYQILCGKDALISFPYRDQNQQIVLENCRSVMLDNGAFTAWKSGKPFDYGAVVNWYSELQNHPSITGMIIPDIIEGSENENDKLVEKFPFRMGIPVWHLHESNARLMALCAAFPVVALGSSGVFSQPKAITWWARMDGAFKCITDDYGRPKCKLHGLRMLDPEIFTRLPLSSADSTHMGRSIKFDQKWRGYSRHTTKRARGIVIVETLERVVPTDKYVGAPEQQPLLFC